MIKIGISFVLVGIICMKEFFCLKELNLIWYKVDGISALFSSLVCDPAKVISNVFL